MKFYCTVHSSLLPTKQTSCIAKADDKDTKNIIVTIIEIIFTQPLELGTETSTEQNRTAQHSAAQDSTTQCRKWMNKSERRIEDRCIET
jgi:hypothetical protein